MAKNYAITIGRQFGSGGREIGKRLGELLGIKAYDIFAQSKNLSVTDASNYHQEVLNNTLGRYIILSLTYRFGSFGGHKGGGPGMGGRGPMGPPRR